MSEIRMDFGRNVIVSPEIVDTFTALHNPNETNRYCLYPTYIYTLNDDTGVRYVGTTHDPRMRLCAHKCYARGKDKSKKGQWLKSILSKGIQPTMVIIEKSHLSIANERERHWVNYFHQKGCDLTNGVYKL